jgi:hypothetical protein
MLFQAWATTDTGMHDEYLDTLQRILRYGLFSNSYKFSLMRALADLSIDRNSNGLVISKLSLARKFVEYYWPLEVRYHLRQAAVPNKNPVVMRLIKREVISLKLPNEFSFSKFTEEHGSRATKIFSNVANQAFRDVIQRFHNIRNGEALSPALFEECAEGLRLAKGAKDLLGKHQRVVELLAIGGWVKFTEQYSSAPRLFEKIEGSVRRKSLNKYRNYLSALHGEQCLYCGVEIGDDFHVDHFVPWVFVAEDKLWNLVPTCPNCNSAKSSNLPRSELLVIMCARNAGIRDSRSLPSNLRKDMKDWPSSEALETHMRSLYSRCEAEGFSVWTPTAIVN